MHLSQWFQKYLDTLMPIYGRDEAMAISHLVFEDLVAVSRRELLLHPQKELESVQEEKLREALLQLQKNTPAQYVTGRAWFHQLEFKVNPAVLIPRPETEELVHEALRFAQEQQAGSLLDIGTGSGCIPISIKKNLTSLQVTAMDISKDALQLAAQNAAMHHCEVEWINSDFLNEDYWPGLPAYDIIISNPPYIPISEKNSLDANVVEHEPQLALFVPNDDPLLFYKKIAAFAKQHLNINGMVFMETHYLYAADVAHHFNAAGYKATVKNDLFGKPRMVLATHYHSQ